MLGIFPLKMTYPTLNIPPLTRSHSLLSNNSRP